MAKVLNTGFVPLRRGLLEHVQQGKMSIGECFLYILILANADPWTGVWISSAGMISSYYGIPHRTCRDWLTKLENKRYLRRFMVRGSRAQYPILIHKFVVTIGAMKDKMLNAWESTSYEDRKYERCHDECRHGAMTVPQSTGEGEKKRRKTMPKASPSASELPDWVPSDAWDAYVHMRKTRRCPLTDAAEKLAFGKLEKLRTEGQDIRAVLEQSVLRGYRDLFPVNGSANTDGRVPQPKPKSEYELDAEAQIKQRQERIEQITRAKEIP